MNKYLNDCYKQGKSVLEIALTIKCSMRCVDCMAGCHPQLRANSSLPIVYDYNTFKEDLQYLQQKIKLDIIDVLGGEIFELHNVFDYLTVIRDCYPNSKITVIQHRFYVVICRITFHRNLHTFIEQKICNILRYCFCHTKAVPALSGICAIPAIHFVKMEFLHV